jgi:hypothetical protein
MKIPMWTLLVWLLSLAPQSTPSSAISGTVKDGATGQPLAGTIVSLRIPSTTTPAPQLASVQRQVTDAAGRFVFRGLAAASGYSLTTSRPGYGDGAFGQTMMLGPSGVITLADAAWFQRADILMWKPGAIAGRVVDETGEPLVGIYVRALLRARVGGQPQILSGPVARTDDRGEYRIPGLGPGQYLIHVPSVQTTVTSDAPAGVLGTPMPPPRFDFLGIAPVSRTDAVLPPVGNSRLVIGNYATPPPAADGRARAYAMAFHPGSPSVDGAAVVTIGASEERAGVDVQLLPVPAVTVSGSVAGPPEALRNLLLRLVPVGLESLANGAEAATTMAAADGQFTFLLVPAGDYIIDAPGSTFELTYTAGGTATALPQPPGLRLTSAQNGTLTSGPPGTGYSRRTGARGDGFWARTPISVGAQDIRSLIVTLRPTLVLTGWFAYESSSRVVRPPIQPSIVAEPADGNPRLGSPRSARPGEFDPEDQVYIEGLLPGDYVLRLQSGGQFMIKTVTLDGHDVTHASIDTTTLSTKSELIITMIDKGATLRGTVRDDSGSTPDAAVLVFPVERAQWSRYGLTPVRLRSATVKGRSDFEISGLPAGAYHVVAVDGAHAMMWQDPTFLERAAAVATRMTLAWGDERQIDLPVTRVR